MIFQQKLFNGKQKKKVCLQKIVLKFSQDKREKRTRIKNIFLMTAIFPPSLEITSDLQAKLGCVEM